DAPRRVHQQRSVVPADQREELIELAVAVDGERAPGERIERDRFLEDDRGEKDAHGCVCCSAAASAPAASRRLKPPRDEGPKPPRDEGRKPPRDEGPKPQRRGAEAAALRAPRPLAARQRLLVGLIERQVE